MSDSTVEEIRSRLDIVDVVSEFTNLQKTGHNFKALCPFHSEKTPSFIVTPDRQTWRCFGACGTGGDVFSFIMKKEGLDFIEALEAMAKRTGVQIERRDKGKHQLNQRLLDTNKLASVYFHDILLNSQEAQRAREYLIQRGISQAIIQNFQLGYAPKLSQGLLDYLSDQGFTAKDYVSAGLGIMGESGEIKGIFRSRIIFPIRDMQAHVIGFGGRTMVDSGPKYINSPQTPIFEKSSILYAGDQAKTKIREKNWAVIVEGYMDAIAAHQFGFKNVVASMGTSLTEIQVSTLKRMANRISLALDSDAAGQEATLRNLKSSWQAIYSGLHPFKGNKKRRHLRGSPQQNVDIVIMPPGEDPDNLIRKNSKLWEELLESTKPFLDYMMEAEVSRINIDAPGSRALVVEEFKNLLVTADFMDQDRYVSKLAKLMNVSEESIKLTINKNVNRPSLTAGRSSGRNLKTVELTRKGGEDVLEEYTLAILIQNPRLIGITSEIKLEVFKDPINQELFRRIINQKMVGASLNSGPDHLTPIIEKLSKTSVMCNSESQLVIALKECLARLEATRLKALKVEEGKILGQETPLGVIAQTIHENALETNKMLKEVQNRGTDL